MTSETAVARVKALQQRTPYPALRILHRLHISQADVAFVAECSQAYVSKMLNQHLPLDPNVVEAVTLLVGTRATSDELWGES